MTQLFIAIWRLARFITAGTYLISGASASGIANSAQLKLRHSSENTVTIAKLRSHLLRLNINGFQAWNMTLDCNTNSGAEGGYRAAANLIASNLLFKYLKVIGYGSRTGAECFVLKAHRLEGTSYQ